MKKWQHHQVRVRHVSHKHEFHSRHGRYGSPQEPEPRPQPPTPTIVRFETGRSDEGEILDFLQAKYRRAGRIARQQQLANNS